MNKNDTATRFVNRSAPLLGECLGVMQLEIALAAAI
jgi:hypothetical protein